VTSTEDQQPQPKTDKSWLQPLQLLTNFAVVAGILVLVFELNQTRDLAQVQTYDNAYHSAISRNLALIGEAPQVSLAKAIFKPDEIQPEDVVVLNRYYTVVVVSWRRLKDKNAVGYFGGGWEQVVTQEARNFNTQFGRKWWTSYRSVGDPDIVAVVDTILDRITIEESFEFYNNLLPSPKAP